MTRRLRRSGALILSCVLLAAVASCAESGQPADTPQDSGAGTITIEHRFGTTEVPRDPDRVVTLDQQWTDTMLALGKQPVGYAADSLMPGGSAPWRKDEPTGEALDVSDGIPLEKVAALKPDLILATFAIGDESTYRRLSKIAPTVAGKTKNYVADMTQLLQTAGKILQRSDKANSVRTRVRSRIDDVAKDNPQLRGRTFVLAQYIVGDSLYAVGDPEDGSSELFAHLKMKLLPGIERRSKKSGQARVPLSTERVDLLDADFLAFFVNGGDEHDLEDIPGFDQLPAVRSGAAAVLDYPTIAALNTPSALSIPYALDQLVPYLKKVR